MECRIQDRMARRADLVAGQLECEEMLEKWLPPAFRRKVKEVLRIAALQLRELDEESGIVAAAFCSCCSAASHGFGAKAFEATLEVMEDIMAGNREVQGSLTGQPEEAKARRRRKGRRLA